MGLDIQKTKQKVFVYTPKNAKQDKAPHVAVKTSAYDKVVEMVDNDKNEIKVGKAKAEQF